MNDTRQRNLQDVLVFALLVAIGVAGRWGQPQWCFTPIAAVAVFAGFYFSRVAIAVIVPIAILAIGDLFLLPPHSNIPVLLATDIAMTVPVWFGRMLRGDERTAACGWKLLMCGLAPATIFFVISNFAVWAFQSGYPKNVDGLVQCYWAAVPFYRWMLAGDIFYLSVLTLCWVIATTGTSAVARTTQSR